MEKHIIKHNKCKYIRLCIKELNFVKVGQENDYFFLLSLKNDNDNYIIKLQLYHERLKNWNIFQTHLTNEGLIIPTS